MWIMCLSEETAFGDNRGICWCRNHFVMDETLKTETEFHLSGRFQW